MTLELEIASLAQDYPNLTAVFEGADGRCVCHLQAYTLFFGMYGIKTGRGSTQVEALLDARSGIDADRIERARVEADEYRLASDHAAREKALDDAVFDSI